MRRAVPFLAAFLGLILFGQGAYIHAKALLAQLLLRRAFAETIATGRITKPWSWADTWPIARIEVKRIHASAIVLEGYRADGSAVVRFDNSGIDPLSKSYELVLSTCWPFDALTSGPYRYLLHATMIGQGG
jgi:hypothetical protein